MSSESEIKTIADITRVHAQQRPRAVAMVSEGRETTFAELDGRASQVANGFIEERLAPQSRIAVLDKNSDNYFEILLGAAKANHVLVAVNWRLALPEIAYVINDATAEILFVGEEYFETIEKIRSELKTVKKVIALGSSHSEWESYAAWRDRLSADDPHIANAGSDVVLQMYTSGTTGHPKGAQLTNDNFLTLIPCAIKEMGEWVETDVSLIAMPLFHIGGTGWGLIGFYVGACNVILRDVIPSEILRLISERRVTKTFFVPAVLLFLLQTTGVEETDFSSLKLIVYGASPIPLDLLRRSMERFKCDFAQVYGMTETTGAFTWLSPEDHNLSQGEHMLSCGKPFSLAIVRVVDAEGNETPTGEVGEIVCSSPQNMKGYWNLPEETGATIRGEWLHTGDAGYMDAEGYLYIHDRIKDMIVSGGENIYPAEVESAIFGHPSVADVAVIGVPDDRWGEVVKAIVVKKSDADVTGDEIIAYARERIAGYKVPKSVDFAGSLPRNPSGKILKRELRAPYWEGRKRQVN